jgi:hypothetical protein
MKGWQAREGRHWRLRERTLGLGLEGLTQVGSDLGRSAAGVALSWRGVHERDGEEAARGWSWVRCCTDKERKRKAGVAVGMVGAMDKISPWW